MPADRLTTPAEYLKAERGARTKQELINGEVSTLETASRGHVLLAENILGILQARLRKGEWRSGAADLRVRVPRTEAYLYPDVYVYRGDGKWLDVNRDTLEDPVVLFEVLSPSTATNDRGTKFSHYKLIDSLTTYVLVYEDWMEVEIFEGRDDSSWIYRSFNQPEQEVSFQKLGVSILLADVYAGASVPSGLRPIPDLSQSQTPLKSLGSRR